MKRLFVVPVSLVVAAFFLNSSTGRAQVPVLSCVADRLDRELAATVARATEDAPGLFTVAVKNLVTGQAASINGGAVITEAASLYKLPVMYEVLHQWEQGSLALTETLTVTQHIRALVWYDPGAPELGTTTTISDALEAMITVSDNTAGHLLLERVRAWRVNEEMKKLGLRQTRIDAGTYTSADDMLRLLELIATDRAVSPRASAKMRQLLLDQRIRDRIPWLLPPGIPVANKTGNWIRVRHDVGIVYGPGGAYVIAILTNYLTDEGRATRLIAQISRAVYDYFASQPSPSPGTPCYDATRKGGTPTPSEAYRRQSLLPLIIWEYWSRTTEEVQSILGWLPPGESLWAAP